MLPVQELARLGGKVLLEEIVFKADEGLAAAGISLAACATEELAVDTP